MNVLACLALGILLGGVAVALIGVCILVWADAWNDVIKPCIESYRKPKNTSMYKQ